MNIKFGSKRIVVLGGNVAIKIGRISPLRFLVRCIFMIFSKKSREHFFSKYGRPFSRAAMNDIFAGIYSNRLEYGYYMESKDYRVMPTTSLFLFGMFILQIRGGKVTEKELKEQYPFKGIEIPDEAEVTKPDQFCRRSDGVIVLVDYGKRETVLLLKAS